MDITQRISTFLNEVDAFKDEGDFFSISLADALKFLGLGEVPKDKAALSAYKSQLIKKRGEIFARADQNDDKTLKRKANAAYGEVEDAINKVNGGYTSALPKTKEEIQNAIDNPQTKIGREWKDNLHTQVKNHVDTLAKQAGLKVVDPGSINKPATFAANVDPTQAAKLANTAKINMEHAGRIS